MKHGLIFNHWFEVFYHCVDHTCLNAEPGVTSSIPAWSHSFVEIDHEIISTAIFLPSADSRRVGSFMSVLSCFCYAFARIFYALWSPAGKGLISWLLFVMSNCEVVTFPLVSWVRCGA